MKRLLVTGASGLLGRQIVQQALALGWEVTGTYLATELPLPIEWHQLDVGDRNAVTRIVDSVKPDAIVHTAYQQRGATMWRTTADGSAFVAVAARAAGARLVHLSSDAIFDGTASPYSEAARPSPVHAYGAAKAAAETAVAAIMPDSVIIRTSLIMSRQPLDQHARMILDIAHGRRADRLFTDEYRCPVAVEDLAAAVLDLVANEFAGVINVAGADAVSRYELGCLVARAQGLSPDLIPAGTVAASGLQRPTDVRLDLSLAQSVLTRRLRGVAEYLRPD